MDSRATDKEISGVIKRLEELGLTGQVSKGVERTVIGVIGIRPPELAEALEVLPGVQECVPISKPFKLSNREFKPENTVVKVGGLTFGGDEVVVIGGPCAVESEEQVIETAKAVKAAGAKLLRGGAFKPSTSPSGFRGLGKEGLELLAKAKAETGLGIVTEVLDPRDVDLVYQYADILQIGTRNMQNFPLLEEAGRTDKPILLKRGLANTIEEYLMSADYILSQGNRRVILCERGIRSFERYTRNTFDVNAIPVIKKFSHLPVIGDPSHGTGHWYLVIPTALAAIAAGADGLLVEVHPSPDHALKDGYQSLSFANFKLLMEQAAKVAEAVGRKLA